MKRISTRTMAFLAVFTALGVVFLYLSCIIPTGQLGFIALASICGVAAVIEAGAGGGAALFAMTALLAFLILPNKLNAAIYACFFGWYPIMKLFAERIRSVSLQWAVKLAFFNAALSVLIFAVQVAFFSFDASVPVIYLIMKAVFIVFDVGVTQIIGFYCKKIGPKMKRGK